MKKRKIYLMRHGKTPGNLRHSYVGRKTDEGLSEDGILELQEIRLHHAEDVQSSYEAMRENRMDYLSSPMKRCIETGVVLFPKLTPSILMGMEEMDFGDFEGKNYEDLNGNLEYQSWIDSGGISKIPNGESREEFIDRTREAFMNAVRNSDKEELFIICHGGSLMAILSSLGFGDYFDFQVGNGEGYRIEIEIEGDKIDAISYDSLFPGLPT
ncbi:MAG: histidine phosphatase family protein [Lachnospiraceae bacterium]|nr:histidine phosphatase family protein [Lachnospiraceae bacterium]